MEEVVYCDNCKRAIHALVESYPEIHGRDVQRVFDMRVFDMVAAYHHRPDDETIRGLLESAAELLRVWYAMHKDANLFASEYMCRLDTEDFLKDVEPYVLFKSSAENTGKTDAQVAGGPEARPFIPPPDSNAEDPFAPRLAGAQAMTSSDLSVYEKACIEKDVRISSLEVELEGMKRLESPSVTFQRARAEAAEKKVSSLEAEIKRQKDILGSPIPHEWVCGYKTRAEFAEKRYKEAVPAFEGMQARAESAEKERDRWVCVSDTHAKQRDVFQTQRNDAVELLQRCKIILKGEGLGTTGIDAFLASLKDTKPLTSSERCGEKTALPPHHQELHARISSLEAMLASSMEAAGEKGDWQDRAESAEKERDKAFGLLRQIGGGFKRDPEFSARFFIASLEKKP